VAEYNASNTLVRRYVHGPGADAPVVWYEGASTSDRRFLHANDQGSIIAVSNSSGATIETQAYGPYGEPQKLTGSRFRYTGQILISELGIYHYKARAYAPKWGRFFQTDPIGYEGGDLNIYAYVGNDPVNNTDPTGTQLFNFNTPRQDPDTRAIKSGYLQQAAEQFATYVKGAYATTAAALGIPVATAAMTSPTFIAATTIALDVQALKDGMPTAAKGAPGLANEIGILRDAARGKGNFGLGSTTAQDAARLGDSWFGKGYTVASDGKTLIGRDGLRQFRPPSVKPRLGTTQANFEQRFQPTGQWQGNGHLDIVP
jgi:RHS repeat-associated protein